jgi:hypothetical protein
VLVIPGAVLTTCTAIENACVAARPPGSATRTLTSWLPACAAEGVHAMLPVDGWIVIPAGARESA